MSDEVDFLIDTSWVITMVKKAGHDLPQQHWKIVFMGDNMRIRPIGASDPVKVISMVKKKGLQTSTPTT
jgi:hypothetical protein